MASSGHVAAADQFGRAATTALGGHISVPMARRPKPFKLSCVGLAEQFTECLQDWRSPQEISHRLRMEFADDPMMHVSHETIYQSLFVQGRGELRRELARCMRTGRIKRRLDTGQRTRASFATLVMISERPAEADDRAVPGHWEGDLIIGVAAPPRAR